MFIEDGKGSGRKAGIDEENKLIVSASVRDKIETINESSGDVWELILDATAPSGATNFFVFQNNGSTTYAVHKIMIASSVAGVYRLSKVTGTPAGGTTTVPQGLNLGIVATLDNCIVQTGASITGLTDANLLKLFYLQANTTFILEIQSRIYLAPGTGIALKAPGAATVNGGITMFADENLH